ncbi:tetratricopeptide repeat protein [Parafrankia sp. FMc2]|uniref:tetratricopeptide repeat protein n=1 Tax=Parafrankia sp. FMc2 TaxID=3233196 RepID=UPI0034D43F58
MILHSLNNLGVLLASLGRPGEALTATEQAVEIRRRLAAAHPAVFEADLSASLTNLTFGPGEFHPVSPDVHKEGRGSPVGSRVRSSPTAMSTC